MRCIECGIDFAGPGPRCPDCSAEKVEVKILSPDEREDFHGLTIQQGNEPEPGPDYPQWPADGSSEYYSERIGNNVYLRKVSFGSQPMVFVLKLVLTAVILFVLIISLLLWGLFL